MTTSGFYVSWADIDAECYLCGWTGETQICDDLEDHTSTWTCPECGVEHPEVTP